MVAVTDKKTGQILWHQPPYTKAEEDDFYRRIGGPIAIYRDKRPTSPPRPNHRASRRRQNRPREDVLEIGDGILRND